MECCVDFAILTGDSEGWLLVGKMEKKSKIWEEYCPGYVRAGL
jgi:hypothetical protein